jgi:uncharacterized small protein (DUF1192 family)
MFEEDAPPKPRSHFVPAALAEWAEAELRAYIIELQSEISRAEAAITARARQRQAADAFFRPQA